LELALDLNNAVKKIFIDVLLNYLAYLFAKQLSYIQSFLAQGMINVTSDQLILYACLIALLHTSLIPALVKTRDTCTT
jgi:hypothetical protein